jgi:transcriptional regulator with XRE-family HTH domain
MGATAMSRKRSFHFSEINKRRWTMNPEIVDYDPVMSIGARIRQNREMLGLSQAGLGEKVGRSQSTVKGWETDDHYPRPDMLLRLAAVFGVDVSWLAFGDTDTRIQSVRQHKDQTIGTRIRTRRRELEITQVALAEMIGAPPTTVSSWEQRKSSPRRDTVPRIARALRVSMRWLEFGEQGFPARDEEPLGRGLKDPIQQAAPRELGRIL